MTEENKTPDAAAPEPAPSHIDFSEHGVKAITVSPSNADAPVDLMSFIGGPPVAADASNASGETTAAPSEPPPADLAGE